MTFRRHWTLDPDITFLNHGSFGATPARVLAYQSELRARIEREPVRFFARDLEGLIDEARDAVAAFVGADPAGFAFVPNATAGVNAVLRSLDLDEHDELLVTNHEYNASRNALEYVASLAGAKVVVVDVPLQLSSAGEVVDRVMEKVTDRTRLLLVDHITSQTAVVMPVERLIERLAARGIDTLVDGAHAPGHVELRLDTLGAAYYTGNLHKWPCAPKGAAFLQVRKNRRAGVRPIAISHGANSTRTDRSRFHVEFDWTGTLDPTPFLAAPLAIDFVGGLMEGGWPEVMERNHALALEARDLLCDALKISPPVPDELLGAMAAVPLPDGNAASAAMLYGDELQDRLLFEEKIEVPVIPWPEPPGRLLRVSAHLHNDRSDYERLVAALARLL